MAFSFDSELYSKHNVESKLALNYFSLTQGNGIELDLHMILTHNIGI